MSFHAFLFSARFKCNICKKFNRWREIIISQSFQTPIIKCTLPFRWRKYLHGLESFSTALRKQLNCVSSLWFTHSHGIVILTCITYVSKPCPRCINCCSTLNSLVFTVIDGQTKNWESYIFQATLFLHYTFNQMQYVLCRGKEYMELYFHDTDCRRSNICNWLDSSHNLSI